MSLKKVGKIIALFYATKASKVNTIELALDEKGVIDDKFYDKDLERSVLISSKESYILAKSHGIDVVMGALGENILIDYNPLAL